MVRTWKVDSLAVTLCNVKSNKLLIVSKVTLQTCTQGNGGHILKDEGLVWSIHDYLKINSMADCLANLLCNVSGEEDPNGSSLVGAVDLQ